MEKKKNRESYLKLLFVLFLLFLPMLTCSAVPQSNSRRVSLNLKSVTVKEFFEAVKGQTGLNFIYNADQAKSISRITVSSKNESVENLLDRVIGDAGYSYQIDGNIVTIVQQQQPKKGGHRLLSGTVRDNEGLPLPGVNVFIKGTQYHALTNADGNYEMNIPESSCTVTFSYVGLKTQELKVPKGTERHKLNVDMQNDNQLDEVVVTGIFKKAKESYTGAATTVTQKDLQMYKGQNLLQTLKNADVSINMAINNTAGSDPNTIPQITIRGNSSLPINVADFNSGVQNTTNTPLIIMDGFEISLTKLMDYNDEEISSINILKDAAATAIYGSRGANGVIVIISKTPTPGRLKVNAEFGLNLELPDLSSYHLLNAAQKLQVENMAGLYNSDNPPTNLAYQEVYNKKYKTILEGVNTDWLSKPLQNGTAATYKIRLEGGSNEFRWSASGSFNDVAGAMKGSSRRTFNGGISLMYTVKNLIFRNDLSVGINKSISSKYGSFSDYVKQQPYNSPYDSDGNLISIFDGFYLNSSIYTMNNPLYDASLNSKNQTGYQELTNSFSVEWRILRELTLRGQLGISGKHNTSDYFLPAENSYFQSSTYQTDEGYFRKGIYRYGTGDSYNYDGNLTLSYNKIFAKKHNVYVGLNYEIAENNAKSYSFSAEGFTSEDLNFLANALQYEKNGKPSGSKSITRRFGFTGNATYTYDNRYYVDLSYRVDGSSNFGSDKKYAPFWSAGIGWNMHNERFLKDNPFINNLRLKASYGQTGSMDVSATGANTVYQYVTDNKYMIWSGATLLGLGNKKLTWQKTNEVNLGLEYAILNYRIKGTFDFYTKKTSNLLSYMDLPSSTGFSSYLANVGSVKNRGFETSINAYVIRDMNKDIIWSIGGQLAYNRNRIAKLSDAIKAQNEEYLKQDVDVSNLFYEGRPQNSIYAVKSLGIDPSTGDEIFVGRDGKLTSTWKASDKVYQGSSDPTFRGIANTMFQWKGLTFNMSFSFYWGGKMYNQTLLNRVEVTKSQLMYTNVDERVLSARWQKPGDKVFFKKISDEQTRASSRFVMSDNVLQLSSMSIQYKWDSKAMRRWTRLQSITFGLNMSDLWHTSSVKMERGTSYPYAHNIIGSIKFLY